LYTKLATATAHCISVTSANTIPAMLISQH
jgi:hypothetical protein